MSARKVALLSGRPCACLETNVFSLKKRRHLLRKGHVHVLFGHVFKIATKCQTRVCVDLERVCVCVCVHLLE